MSLHDMADGGRCERCGDRDGARTEVDGVTVTLCETCTRFVQSGRRER